MGAFAKQVFSLVAGQMAGSNQKANFVVKTLRTGYVLSGGTIAVIWYSAYRNERVQPGSGEFPFPGVKKLKRQFKPDRPEQELSRPAGAGTGASVQTASPEPSHGSFQGMADGRKLLARHPELKPGVAKVTETIMLHFPQLSITATTNGTHVSDSYHYLGRAVDLAGPAQVMDQAATWIEQNLGHVLTEGIHNPGLSIKDKHSVPSSFWGSETWAAHANHIHVAV